MRLWLSLDRVLLSTEQTPGTQRVTNHLVVLFPLAVRPGHLHLRPQCNLSLPANHLMMRKLCKTALCKYLLKGLLHLNYHDFSIIMDSSTATKWSTCSLGSSSRYSCHHKQLLQISFNVFVFLMYLITAPFVPSLLLSCVAIGNRGIPSKMLAWKQTEYLVH